MKNIDPARFRRILIRGTNWVGDAVMSIPAMREIRRLFPYAHIALLVRPWVRDVYSAVDFVDEIIEYDKSRAHKGWRGLLRLARMLAARRFELAILLQNSFEAAFIAWMARIPYKIGYARDARSMLLTHPCTIDPEIQSVHQAYYYLGILSAAGLLQPQPWKNPECRLDINIGVTDADRQAAQQLLNESGVSSNELMIGLNPGAYYGGAKRWLLDRYARVADQLAARHDARILIFGSAGELSIAREIAAQMNNAPTIMAGRTTLGQLMAIIKMCHLLITNDSGPMHLAAALNVPQIAIFGSTSDAATGPLSSVAAVIRQPVDCSPCFLRECPTDLRCMTRVSVEQVLDAAAAQLRSGCGQR